MGIPGIQKFITEKVKDGVSKVQMIDEILKWKQENPKQQPIIVIRAKEVIKNLIQSNIELASYGGRHQIFRRRLYIFFNSFLEAGAKLVFFGNGHKCRTIITEKCKKMDKDYMRCIEKLNDIDNEKEICFKYFSLRFGYRMQLGLCEREIAHHYGEFRMCDENINSDIMRYVKGNDNVLAILAKNTDFLAFDLKTVKYWHCGIDHLNIYQLETSSYSQRALRECLQMTPFQYQVMMAILSMHYLEEEKKYKLSKIILNRLDERSCSLKLIHNTSEFVYANVCAQNDSIDFIALQAQVFDNLDVNSDLLESHFQKYNITTTLCNNKGGSKQNDELQKYLMESFVLNDIWNDNMIKFPIQFVDLRQWNADDSKSFTELFLSVHKRLMGIILKHKNDPTIKRKFCLKPSHDTATQVVEEEPIFPDFCIPDLKHILTNQNDGDKELTETKWMMLFWILDLLDLYADDGIMKKVWNVSEAIQPVVITALLLHREYQITQIEADTLIISENDVINGKCDQTFSTFPAEVDGRTIRVAHLYIHMRVLVNSCLQICGIDLFKKPVLFDGIHFHELKAKFTKYPEISQQQRDEIKSHLVDTFLSI